MPPPVAGPTTSQAEWSKHLLTDDERREFEEQGFLLVRDALSPAALDALNDAADQQLPPVHPRRLSGDRYNIHDLIGLDDRFLDLIDWPTTFPKVFGILGWHIQLFHTQLVEIPPGSEGQADQRQWHQDNNRMYLDFGEGVTHPRVSMKVGYFLSDASAPGRGNLCVVPGSHRSQNPSRDADGNLTGGIEVLADAGDAVLFDRRTWHSASGNKWDRPRRIMFYGYSYRWLRPKSSMHHPNLLERVDPIRRQLLGWTTNANAYFAPSPEDVPLKAWIAENLGDRAVAP